jgi:hypothetical protein
MSMIFEKMDRIDARLDNITQSMAQINEDLRKLIEHLSSVNSSPSAAGRGGRGDAA